MATIRINGVTYPAKKRAVLPGANGEPLVFELPEEPDAALNGYSKNAVQNKVVNAALQDVRQRQTSPYNFKGAVATLADLPSTGQEVNDTYYVEAVKYRVTWTGSAWQQSSMEESKYTDELADLKNDIEIVAEGHAPIYFDSVFGEYPNAQGGFTPYSTWVRTDYIPVNGGEIINIVNINPTHDNAWYDENKNIISRFEVPVGNPASVTAPANARYMVVSNNKQFQIKTIYREDLGISNVISGTRLNLTADTIAAICGSDLNNLPNNKVYGCSVLNGSLANVPTNEFTGQIITFGKSDARTNSDVQLHVSGDGNVYKRLYWSGAWTAWESVGTQFVKDADANALATTLGGTLAKVTGACTFTANNNYWTDLPSDTGYIFINQRYADNWNIQTAIGVGVNNTYQRITKHDGSGTIYRDWSCVSGSPNVKILAVGDSICAGQRNGGKGFVGDLGLPYKNIAVSGSTLSNVWTSETTIPDQLTRETDYEPDIIIADGGINDYYYNAPLGEIPTEPAATDAEAEALDRDTVTGAAGYLFFQMVKMHPTAQRFFLITHKVNRNDQYFRGYAPALRNAQGYTQQDLHDALLAVCNVYNVHVIDVYRDGMLNTKFPQYVSPVSYNSDHSVTDKQYVDFDGLHPLALGYLEAYVPLVRQALGVGTVKAQ